MTIICLVRHGETDWNAIGMLQGRTDIPLNETGFRQAEECSELLKTSQWDVIITSPLKRAKQTAEIINKKVIVPVVEMEDFLERDYGDAEGMTYEERNSKFPDNLYPNQEERTALNKRVIEGIEKINQEYGDKKILLVAHGAVINAILAVFSNGKIGSGKTNLINACISNIYLHKDKWRIKDFNQISHLSKYI
ncbi:histidine phosphatase family protein [Chryseomicrobium palamuruense]|uniref:Histidine phosphatase family protein n=1 Tax=Chryseomicrobium palamuruense TaxID=682973 RepID=A0ABV8UYM8_9BACL